MIDGLTVYMATGPVLGVASAAAAFIYGGWLVQRAPSAARTAIKTLAIGLLAIASWRMDLPAALTIGLALSALGDAFLPESRGDGSLTAWPAS